MDLTCESYKAEERGREEGGYKGALGIETSNVEAFVDETRAGDVFMEEPIKVKTQN